MSWRHSIPGVSQQLFKESSCIQSAPCATGDALAGPQWMIEVPRSALGSPWIAEDDAIRLRVARYGPEDGWTDADSAGKLIVNIDT